MRGAHPSQGRRPKKLIALLEAGQYEGEDLPDPDPDHQLALQVWNMLSNGTGSIDWAGLPMVAAVLGIDDLETLIRRLMTIKHHRPGDRSSEQPAEE